MNNTNHTNLSYDDEIEILMLDNCTKAEAVKHLKDGTIVYADFEEKFDEYIKGWNYDDELVDDFRNMVKTHKPIDGWSIVKYNGKTCYIEYVL